MGKMNIWAVVVLALISMLSVSAFAAQVAPISGEIERILINDINDHWSGGEIVVGGQRVIIPRNLLMDLPANRLTLTELFEQAPAACIATGETGLAKADTCNPSGTGAFASISANIVSSGNTIAGDVLIEKGVESVTGTITFINYTEGYFRLNGILNDPNTGVMVRLNDPDGRHTVQQGLGCAANSPNCSPDPRFTLDPDNYINIFSTGYPLCIPSTVPRTFADVLGLGTTTAQAAADGTGDVLCPVSNRIINGGLPVDDSRRFAPIMVGDSITAEGNFETVNGVRFLSAHTTMVNSALTTKNLATQPDYLFLDEVEVDAPGFQNQRVRTLIIGYATKAPTDVLIWSLQYDPINNEPHQFPLATVQGCDAAAGEGTCGAQGLIGAGANIFKIRHDIDFLAGAKPRLNPCAHLQADPRMGTGFCPNGGGTDVATQAVLAEQFGILSPIMHEIFARTGQKFANPNLVTLDVNGNAATNGEYLFPFGMNLGGVSTPEMNEIDLNALATPISFSGIPWLLDRRLSPGGCIDTNGDGAVDCEATPQPLDPFPYEGLDPRTQADFAGPLGPAGVPTGVYNDPHFTATSLSDVRNRIFSYVNANGEFNGDNTLLAWPPVDPAAILINPTPSLLALKAMNVGMANLTLPVDEVQQFIAISLDQSGAPMVPQPVVTWASSDPNVATVSATGLVTGISPGSAIVTATAVFGSTTLTSTVIITVAYPPITSTIGLNAGWNLVSMPVQPINAATGLPFNHTSETFGQLSGASVVSEWSSATQQYTSHVVGFPLNNFPITNGMGFWANVANPNSVAVTGTCWGRGG